MGEDRDEVRYRVKGSNGAVVREGCEMDSEVSGELAFGDEVVGLESRRDLNGRLCTVKSYDLKLQRYKLKLDGIADGINEKAELAVKPANIELVDEDVLHILE